MEKFVVVIGTLKTGHEQFKVVLRPKKQFFFFFGFQNYVN